MEELADRLARVETKLIDHISREDQDRKDQMEVLKCVKQQVMDIRLELAEYRGKVGIAGAVIGLVVAGVSMAVSWFKQ